MSSFLAGKIIFLMDVVRLVSIREIRLQYACHICVMTNMKPSIFIRKISISVWIKNAFLLNLISSNSSFNNFICNNNNFNDRNYNV